MSYMEAVDRAYDESQRRRWRSVKDEPPPVGETVVVGWEGNRSIRTGTFSMCGELRFDYDWSSCYTTPSWGGFPTHWMPLPEPPK